MSHEHQVEEAPDIFRPRFEATFSAHHAEVLAFALRRVANRSAAEDIVGETFAIAWRRRDVIPDPPLPWLYGVARRVLANQRRSEKRHTRLREAMFFDSQSLAPRGDDPARLIGGREEVLAAFARLKEADREVLRLVAWEQVEPAEAARILGCSAATFRVRLHRARRKLERELAACDTPTGENRRKTTAQPQANAEEAG